jgi:hypothetical protein
MVIYLLNKVRLEGKNFYDIHHAGTEYNMSSDINCKFISNSCQSKAAHPSTSFSSPKKFFMKKFFVLPVILLLAFTATSQMYYVPSSGGGSSIWELGGEYQYHCNHNLSQNNIGIRYDGFSGRSDWNFGVSYNIGHNKNKDRSKESGIAVTAGYRYGFSYGAHGNLFAGARVHFEFDKWKDKDGKQQSKESVFVPQLEGGYQYLFGTAGHVYGTPAIGYGYGIKLKSEGTESKGDEGGRFISGVSVGYRF